MPGAYHLNEELAYLVGCGLEPYGCALTDQIEEGQRLSLDEGADLAIVLSGTLHATFSSDCAVELSGPTVVLRSDVLKSRSHASDDLRMLSMSQGLCASMMSRHRAFRDLFYDAMTTRIRTLEDLRSQVIPA